ncbi:3-oxoacyl-[acyl-carrier protein] reductase [Tepidamorphus gemmatus]|uniref:3-oxoacyl-[acyl-carrier protein] reductase n=1 Tax=Tepidamorphus gemmatus TaxID=747076 RepID=A0A4R3MEF4_9HYPH|nr:SDR family oxidoreductase [Tepidamorphus gemmatus]TCT12040.1 3-oxoacyl-[acyl-carrier protein] reductase [Tepidamorphus gemmatus]
MAGRLEGKVAVITGAASGFGEGMAKRFAEEGACVVVADMNGEGAERVAGEIGANAVAVEADVTDPLDIDAMLKAAAQYGPLDILVNNAGASHRNMPMTEVDEATFDRVLAVNTKAIYLACIRAVPMMAERGGVIINTASTAGIRPRPGLVWYNATKGWVITATKSMAIELAPKRIRVNCLCPVAGETGMLHLFMGEDTPEKRAQFISTIPLGRLSTPRDVANAALWLASDEAEFITGVALEVDGGRCI